MAFSGTIARCSLILLFGSFLSSELAAQEDNLDVLDRWIEWSDGENMLIHYLNRQAFDHLDLRDQEISRLSSKDDWLSRQKKVRETVLRILGPFPEKTSLNPRVTGVFKEDGFRIEKVVYESMPGLYVTAALFVPEGIQRPTPAIIQVSGHGFAAFRSRGNQRMIFNLVRKGFVVLAIDPLGQGERIQYWDPAKNGSMMGSSPTREHSHFGDQIVLDHKAVLQECLAARCFDHNRRP